jgi:hypothetical protein
MVHGGLPSAAHTHYHHYMGVLVVVEATSPHPPRHVFASYKEL